MQTPEAFQQAYRRSHYRLVGKAKHSAIKPCHWMIAKLYTGRDNRNCYKGYFGIRSEKCMQVTPSLPYCTHSCVFCWRDVEAGSLGPRFTVPPDDPKDLVDAFVRNQVNIVRHGLHLDTFLLNQEIMADMVTTALQQENKLDIAEYNALQRYSKVKNEVAITLLRVLGVVDTADLRHYELGAGMADMADAEAIVRERVTTKAEIERVYQEAQSPGHAAISLAGEPTLYPFIDELVEEFRLRSCTTFIVTNGTTPDTLAAMNSLPTQLYITLPPPDEALYRKIHRPLEKGMYGQIMKTLDLVGSLSCRTCLRITLVKGLNGLSPESLVDGYVDLVNRANPNFLEIKGFAVEARALLLKKRLGLGGTGDKIGESASFAPSHEDVMEFARQLADAGGFQLLEQVEQSRDVLLRVNWPEGKSIRIEKP
jgi:wyosine [tRNA(Phe)-imidazoG37] synthetase (radical SAM superfamily)